MTGPRVHRELREAAIAKYGRDPYAAFVAHRAGSAHRGIPFLFTFEEWWALWEPRFAERGRRRGQLVMSRPADVGPYSGDNVRLITCTQNLKEAALKRNFESFAEAWGDNAEASDWLHERWSLRDV